MAKEVISTIYHVQKSSTFQDLWTQCGKKAQSARKNDEAIKPYLSISEVVENVWKPTFHDWYTYAKSAMDGTISLGNVDKLFGYKNQKNDLERELLWMFQLVQGHPPSGVKRLQTIAIERVDQIQRYQQLGLYASAADTIWEFKEAMGFTGDFNVIEDLRNQVSKFIFIPPCYSDSSYSSLHRRYESGFPARCWTFYCKYVPRLCFEILKIV